MYLSLSLSVEPAPDARRVRTRKQRQLQGYHILSFSHPQMYVSFIHVGEHDFRNNTIILLSS